MQSKWTVLGSTMVAAVLVAAGLSVAQDEEQPSELNGVMVQVQKANATVIRSVRNEVFYRRYKGDVAESGKQIVELLKKAKPLTETIKDTEIEGGSDPIEQWNKTMDACIKEAQGFAELAAKEGTTQAQAKDAYRAVSKACTNCHNVFRIDEADF